VEDVTGWAAMEEDYIQAVVFGIILANDFWVLKQSLV
jgi:hypothetical protein